jgi:glutamine---fructose-6-phosphate transaminase (isomerizing)
MNFSSLGTNSYMNDILAQPDALSNTLKILTRTDYSTLETYASRLNSGEYQRIVLTGMGSSLHVFYPMYIELLNHHLNVQMIETSELIHYAEALLEPKTLVIAASQSGSSGEIVHLIENIHGKVPLIGVTNTPNSLLATHANSVILTDAGSESTVSCKTYVTALAAVAILSKIITGQKMETTLAELEQAPELLTRYLAQWQTHVEKALESFKGIQSLLLAGRGSSLAAVLTGGLVIKEAAHFHSEGMSCATLRHGPLEMMSPKIFSVVFEGDGKTTQLNANLVNDIRKAGGRSEFIHQSSKLELFTLPPSPLTVLPICEILPIQMFSIALALSWGHNPGQFIHGQKVTVIE